MGRGGEGPRGARSAAVDGRCANATSCRRTRDSGLGDQACDQQRRHDGVYGISITRPFKCVA